MEYRAFCPQMTTLTPARRLNSGLSFPHYFVHFTGVTSDAHHREMAKPFNIHPHCAIPSLHLMYSNKHLAKEKAKKEVGLKHYHCQHNTSNLGGRLGLMDTAQNRTSSPCFYSIIMMYLTLDDSSCFRFIPYQSLPTFEDFEINKHTCNMCIYLHTYLNINIHILLLLLLLMFFIVPVSIFHLH